MAEFSTPKLAWQWNNFMNCHSGCALDAPSMQEGGEARQWKVHDQANQKWRLETSSTFSGACQIITQDPETDEEFALEVKGDVSASEILLVPPNRSSKHQMWWVEPVQSVQDIVWISSFVDRDCVLDVMRGSTEEGAPINLCRRTGELSQQWRMVSTVSARESTMFPFLQREEEAEVSVDFSEIGTRLKEVVESHGFAIVNNVVPPHEVEGLLSAFGNDLMDVCDSVANSSPDAHDHIRFKYQQLSTAPLHEVPYLWPGGGQKLPLGGSYGLAQGRMAWSARMHPNVRAIFRHLHSDELEGGAEGVQENDGLVAGMDPVFFRPRHSLVSENQTTTWAHADLNVHCLDGGHGKFTIYQSILQLWDNVSLSNSTTVIWPKSHKTIFPQICVDTSAVGCDHFVRIDTMTGVLLAPEYLEGVAEDIRVYYNEQREIQQQRPLSDSDRKRVSRWLDERYLREARRVPIRAGSMVIWNSRTIHQGWDDGYRLAMPVCWEPAMRKADACPSNPPVIDNRKLRIAASGSISTHWASLGREHDVMPFLLPRAGNPCFIHDSDAECCELATRGMYYNDSQQPAYVVPFTIKESCAHQYGYVLELCEQLKASGDADATVAAKLREMVKPQIIRVL